MATSGLVSAGRGAVDVDVAVGPNGPVFLVVSWVPTGGSVVPGPTFDEVLAGGHVRHRLAVPASGVARMMLIEFHLDPGETVTVTVGQPGGPAARTYHLTPAQSRLRFTVVP
ncbi:MAG: hypothetical protein H6735_12130 [Alphaproteobacteria bacterium]|nr:hypothetical protein [Alphaproteobacteria bacterium]